MTAPDLALRIVMVSSDITDDIDDGLELNAEPTVILQGSVEAVKAAAKLFGEQVAITRAPLAEALAVPETAALVEAVDSAFANVDAQIDDAGEFTSASWLALRHAVAGLWTLHPSQAALRAIGERADG